MVFPPHKYDITTDLVTPLKEDYMVFPPHKYYI